MLWHEQIRLVRYARRLSLRDLEKATGLSNAYLSQLENGKIKEPGFYAISKVLKFYGLDYEVMFEPSTDDIVREMREAMMVDPEMLHKPMGS